jgi:hypothetical protein
MKSTGVVPAPAPDAEALIKEARRRQRRRYAATGVAVVAVLAAAVGAFAGSRGASSPRQASQPRPRPAAGQSAGPHVPGPIPGSVNPTVLMWPAAAGQDGTIDLDNLRTGQRGQAAPVVDPGENQPIMLISGWIVYVSDNSGHCANASAAQDLSYGGNFGYYACRTLRVFDVVTGRLQSFAAPAGTTGWAPTHGGNWAWSVSEIAPSGQMMAAEAVVPPDSQGTARRHGRPPRRAASTP